MAQRTAVVTGAASGIGRAVTTTLQEAGCHLVCIDRGVMNASARSTSNANATWFDCDVSDPDQVAAVFTQQQQPVSILVNCAGITRDGWTKDMSLEDWNRVLQVNLTGTFLMCQAFLRHHHEGQQRAKTNAARKEPSEPTSTASIINIGSIVSEQGNIGQANYASSKGGVIGLTRALAKETARKAVRVNAVLPGFIATPMTEAVPSQILQTIPSRIALQHLGQAQDVANVVAFLASDRSGYITGETIECSGMISL